MPGPPELDGIALSLAALARRGPSGRHLAVATVAEAVRRGVRWLDVTDGPELEYVLSILAEVRSVTDGSLTLFVPAGQAARTPTVSLGELRSIQVVEGPDSRPGAARDPSEESGIRWAVDAPWNPVRAGEGPTALRWLVVRGSLLQAARLIALAPAARTSGLRLLLTDPFAGGLLSGGGPVGPSLEAGRPVTPWDVASLRRAYAPVLRLGFLTADRRRTLPQAVVGFARALPAMVSLPVRDPGDLDAWLEPARSAALSEQELAQLRDLGDLAEPGPPT